MNTIDARLSRIELLVASVAFIIMVVVILLSAITRLFGYPIIWAGDIAQILFIWAIMLGGDVVLKRNNHVGVAFIMNKVPAGLQRGVMLMMRILMLGFTVSFAFFAFQAMVHNMGRTFGTIGISYNFATGGVCAGCVLMSISIAFQIVRILKRAEIKSEDEEMQEELAKEVAKELGEEVRS